MIRLRIPVTALILALIVAWSAGCSRSTAPLGDGSSPTPTGTVATNGTGQSPIPTGTAGTEPAETDASPTGTETGATTEASETVGANPDVDPAGPDFTLYTLPECSVVPGGAISGADAFTMMVAVRNSGPGSWNNLVPYKVISDTGLSASGNTALSTGSGFTAMQVDLNPSDYSRSHRFTITADPDNQVRERDETNNQLVISVALPPRPTGTTNISCSSP